MISFPKKIVYKLFLYLSNLIGWIIVLFGSLSLGLFFLPVIIMLMTDQIKPGSGFFLDATAQSLGDTLISASISVGIIAVGIVFMFFARKFIKNKIEPTHSHHNNASNELPPTPL